MKAFRALLSFVVSLLLSTHAFAAGPVSYEEGWHTLPAKKIPLAQSRRPLSAAAVEVAAPLVGNNAATQSSAAAVHPELRDLARNLEYSPAAIYDYVLNRLGHAPYRGFLKGPLQTYLDQSGNDIDLSVLMACLLAVSSENNNRIGEDIRIIEGSVRVQAATLAAWLGCEAGNDIVAGFLTAYSIPFTQEGNDFEITRYWVEFSLSGTVVQCDPARRSYTQRPSLDVAALSQFDMGALLGAAGGQETAHYVQNVNIASVNEYLTSLTARLRAGLIENFDGETFADTLGGLSVSPLPPEFGLPADLQYTQAGSFPWTEVPLNLVSSLTIDVSGTTHTIQTSEIESKNIALHFESEPVGGAGNLDFGTRIHGDTLSVNSVPVDLSAVSRSAYVIASISPASDAFALMATPGGTELYSSYTYTQDADRIARVHFTLRTDIPPGSYSATLALSIYIGSSRIGIITRQIRGSLAYPTPVLTIDGQEVARGSRSAILPSLRLTIAHEAAGVTQNVRPAISPLGTYSIVNGFGPSGSRKRLEYAQKRLEAIRGQSGNDSRAALTASFDVAGRTWLEEIDLYSGLFSRLGSMRRLPIHEVGLVGQSRDGYFIDFPALLQVVAPTQSGPPGSFEKRLLSPIHVSSALEHGVLEQLQQRREAVSTTKILKIANTEGLRTYLLTAANFGEVASELAAYDAAPIQSLLDNGYSILIPQHPNVRIDQWTGFGYLARSASQAQAIIKGGLHGGYSARPLTLDIPALRWDYLANFFPESEITKPASQEPVELSSGDYLFSADDLVIGNEPEPLGIALRRNYRSSHTEDNTHLGAGWTHNWNNRLKIFSDERAALGGRRAEDASAHILTAFLVQHLDLHPQQTAKIWLLKAVIANWGVDRLRENAVAIATGDSQFIYIRHPNGEYSRPPGISTDLVAFDDRYELRGRFGDVKTYTRTDDFGNARLTRWQNINGAYLSVNYSGEKPSVVKDSLGRELRFDYDTNSRLIAARDEFGRRVEFTYNDDGLLFQSRSPEGFAHQFEYDQGRIAKVTNPEGQVLAINTYDDKGRVISQLSQGDGARRWTFLYTDTHTVEIDPLGGRTTYRFNDGGALIDLTNAEGISTSSLLDAHSRPVLRIDGRSNTFKREYDNRLNLLRELSQDPALGNFVTDAAYEYDENHNLITEIDALGRRTVHTYNAKHDRLTTTDPLGNQTTFVYNDDRTLAKTIDPAGYETVYLAYDQYRNPAQIQLPDGGVERYSYSPLGDLLSYQDAKGNIWTYKHDRERRRTETTDPLNQTSRVAYRFSGQILSETDPQNHTAVYEYNALDQPVAITDPRGETTRLEYDLRDKQVATITPLGRRLETLLDGAGRVVGSRSPLGLETHVTLDGNGNPAETINPDGERSEFSYDRYNRIADTTNPRTEKTSYAYDLKGNRTGVTAPNGAATVFAYDAANRPTSLRTPEGRVSQMQYDARGLIKETIKPSGATTAYRYTPAGRTDRITDALGVRSLAYDANGNLLSIAEGTKTVSWQYDALSRPVSYTNEGAETITYGYDAAGRLSSLTYPGAGNRVVTYAYRPDGRMESVDDWLGNHTAFSWDSDGRLTRIDLPNGARRSISYDADSRITDLTDTDRNGYIINRLHVGYDDAGRVTVMAGVPLLLPLAETPHYSAQFDRDNRLTGFAGQTATSHVDGYLTYGPLGVSAGFSAYSFDVRERLLSAGGTDYRYSLGGYRNRLVAEGLEQRFTCDPRPAVPRLLKRTIAGRETHYIYGIGLLYELNPDGEVATYHYDLTGNTVALCGNDGIAVKARWQYGPYGSRWHTEGQADTPFLFNGLSGAQSDPNGLICMGRRYYDPGTRRFVSEDPAGFAGGNNWYAFAGGNPLTYIDPTGLGPVGSSAFNFNRAIGWLESSAPAEWLANASNAWPGYARSVNDVASGFSDYIGATEFYYGSTYLDSGRINDYSLYEAGVWAGVAADIVSAGRNTALRGLVADATKSKLVNLASPQRTTHILTGDATGGGHLFPGAAGKSPFPKGWSGDRVMHEISDVATDPQSLFSLGRGGRTVVTGTRDGVNITVILESPSRGGGIVTGFPTNLPRNP